MKLVTWNTQWCCGLDGTVSPRRIVEGARALADFDLLCLQEIAQGYPALPGSPGDQPAQLQALLPDFQFFFGAAVDEFTPTGQRQRFGNLVATRLPVLQVEQHRLPWPADGKVRAMPRQCTSVTLMDPELGAVRVMTTHLEYYSRPQRLAQATALHALTAEAQAQAAAPPAADNSGGPFQSKSHPRHLLLCGDFNLGPHEPEYALLQSPGADPDRDTGRLHDAWTCLHGDRVHAPTFHVFDRTYGPEPLACDFVFVSDSLVPHLRRIEVDVHTRASDHQPVVVELGGT